MFPFYGANLSQTFLVLAKGGNLEFSGMIYIGIATWFVFSSPRQNIFFSSNFFA
jgi:hypothetical protein